MSTFDYVFFVEDEFAQLLLKKMLVKYITEKDEFRTVQYSIVPVGGFFQTTQFALRTKEKLLNQTRVYPVLDSDAFEDLDSKPRFKNLNQQHKDKIRSLGCTPEVWAISQIEKCERSTSADIKEIFHCEVGRAMASSEYQKCTGANLRNVAKQKMGELITYFAAHSDFSEEEVKDRLFSVLVKHMPIGEVMSVVGPILN